MWCRDVCGMSCPPDPGGAGLQARKKARVAVVCVWAGGGWLI